MGFKLAIMMGLLMVAMGGAFAWYFNDSQAKMAILHQNNAKLETAVATSEATIGALQADFKRQQEELQKINNEFGNIRRQNQVLENKLAKHDLAILGAEKPGLVTKIINNASAKAGRCFELLSGAPLTETEKNATSGKAFNSECPWLWPGTAAN